MLFRTLLALFGLVELLRPDWVVDAWMRLATTADSEFEVRPWAYTGARLEGAVILLVAFWLGRRDGPAED
jgi:hypothetical protein